jgi:hypothetical protein
VLHPVSPGVQSSVHHDPRLPSQTTPQTAVCKAITVATVLKALLPWMAGA